MVKSREFRIFWNKLEAQNRLPSDWEINEDFLVETLNLFPNEPILVFKYVYYLYCIKLDIEACTLWAKKLIQVLPNAKPAQLFYAEFKNEHHNDSNPLIIYYKRELKEDPNNTLALIRLAECFSQDNNNIAHEYLVRALKVEPVSKKVLRAYGNYFKEKDQFHLAKEYFLNAIFENPKDIKAQRMYGMFLSIHDQNPEISLRIFKDILEKDGSDLFTLHWYIHQLKKEEDFDTLSQLYFEKVQEYPKDLKLLLDYANYLSILEDYEKAEYLYKQALAKSTNSAESLLAYAYFLADHKRADGACEQVFKKAIQMYPKNERLLAGYGRFLKIRKEDFPKAKEYFQKSIAENPSKSTNFSTYAEVLLELNELNEAEKNFKKGILRKNARQRDYIRYADFLNYEKKDFDQAEVLYKKVVEAETANKRSDAAYARFLSYRREDHKEALKYFERNRADDYLEECVYHYYPYVLLRDGQLEKAEAIICDLMEHHEHETLILWFWFYRLCYFEKWYEEAEVKVKEMIIDELNEVYWEINTGLEYAKSIQHPKLEVIKKYNELISYVG